MTDTPTPTICDNLTPEQSTELAALKADPKFGALVSDAFKTWCSGAARPKTFGANVVAETWDDDNARYIHQDVYVIDPAADHNGCCLMGAAMLGKPTTGAPLNIYQATLQAYNLTHDELVDMFRNFDRPGLMSFTDTSAADIGSRSHRLAASIWGIMSTNE